MAVELLSGFDMSGVTSAVIIAVYAFIVLAIIGVGAWFIWRETQYKVKFIVRLVTGDRTLIYMDKARIIKKRGLATKWRLKKRKDFVPVPPKEAIDVTTKGRLVVEAYYTQDGEYVYLTDDVHKVSDGVGSVFPVKTNDKEFYQNQVEEGMKKYNSKKLAEILLQLAPVIVVMMILILFMVFFDKTVQPTIEFGRSLASASQNLAHAIEVLNSGAQGVVVN